MNKFTGIALAIALPLMAAPAAALAIDSDGDGVEDHSDFCPDAQNVVAVDDFGCSAVHFFNDSKVYFRAGVTTPKPSTLEVMSSSVETMRQALARDPQLTLVLTGYGDRAGQQALGLRRARYVIDFFTARGISAQRLLASSAPYSPEVNCDAERSERCFERNRRVVMSVR